MASPQNPHQKKIIERYYEHHDTIQSNKLSEIVSDLWIAEGSSAKAKLWGKAQVALMRVGVDPTRIASIVNKQDMEALAKLVAEVDAGNAKKGDQGATASQPKVPSVADGRTIKEAQAQRAAEGGFDSLEEANLKRALKAFRRKLKSIKRDDESGLGNRYVTYGKKSGITAISPPNEYPKPVWEKLVELGRLKRGGSGTYELP